MYAIQLTLTSTGNGEHDLRRMPGTDTSDLAETLVGLTRKLLGTPTVRNTLETVTLGHRNNIDDLVLLKDGADLHGLLEEAVRELDLVGDGATVDLDLHEVGPLLGEAGLADLSVRKDTDDRAVLADTLELAGNGLAAVLGVLLGVARERLLLGAVPVLVEATLELVGEMGRPDGGEGTETTRSLDVANDTDNNHGGSLDNRNRLHDLALVHLCNTVHTLSPTKLCERLTGTRTVKVTDNVGHTGLVAHDGRQVNGLLGVILIPLNPQCPFLPTR